MPLRLAIACVALAACGARPARPIDPGGVAAPVRLAFAAGRVVSLAVIDAGQLRVTRTVTAPGTIVQLDWVGEDPVVRLGAAPMGFGPDGPVEPDDDPQTFGQIARITARGYEPFAPLPAATWAAVHGSDDHALSEWALVSPADGSIWQGYCGNGFSADGMTICEHFLYARLAPAPLVTQAERPRAVEYPDPDPVAAPLEPKVELVPIDHDDDRVFLRCSDRGAAIDVPDSDHRGAGFISMQRPTWLSADPPIFRTAKVSEGFSAVFEYMVFERCEASARYGGELATGPDGLAALLGGSRLIVFQHGRVIGTGDAAATLVRFAPRG